MASAKLHRRQDFWLKFFFTCTIKLNYFKFVDDEFIQFIQQGFDRMRRQGWAVSIITLGFAAFLTWLYWIEPGTYSDNTRMKILFLLVLVFFCSVGLYMLYIVVVKSASQHTELLRIMQQQPSLIKRVYHYKVVSRASNTGASNPVGSQHYVRIEYTNGKMIQLSYPFQQISQVLDKIYRQIPHSRPK